MLQRRSQADYHARILCLIVGTVIAHIFTPLPDKLLHLALQASAGSGNARVSSAAAIEPYGSVNIGADVDNRSCSGSGSSSHRECGRHR
ncbi:hypothetical protein JKP88DRAFT_227230 [Tribonema minus]|uniref:Uncharacterized protein n=1 Tax=Tribonema minus TaxID=303371 RepID=A0A836C8G6_9STRA|nr:hypothetical protein JKP88DRAFT_227230 [Tribonema minus]